MTHYHTINKAYLLPLLIVAGGMFPPLTGCWDDSLIPKWYATTIALVVCGVICQWKAIREVSATEWLSCIADAAAIGILFQAGYTLIDQQIHFSHPSGGITGTFDVPAGLALTVCLLLPFILWQRKNGQRKTLYSAALLTGILLVALSQSRAGIVALCAEGVVLLLFCHIKRWTKTIAVLCVSIGACLIVLHTKQDSSTGRAFIMEQTCSLIQEKPLAGHGFHGFSREYMTRQQHYFQKQPDSEAARLADEIKHPLNEFLQTWVNYGVSGALLLLLCILLPVIAYPRHPLVWMNTGALFIFCALSYPLNYPIAWVFLVGGVAMSAHKWIPFDVRLATIGPVAILALGLLIALPCDIMLSRAHNYTRRGGHSRAIATYGECKKLFGTFPFSWVYPFRCHQYLYNYTYELYSMGHLDEARQTATECALYANGYNLQLLTGDICQMQGDFETAITHYQNAADMCPVRFAPLSGMLQTYQQTGDTVKADSIAQVILNKPIKIPSSDIDEMKAEAKRVKSGFKGQRAKDEGLRLMR